jgi:hypothetical protein
MCRRELRGSCQQVSHLPKGFNQSWRAGALRCIGCRSSRPLCTGNLHYTSSHTICTPISAQDLLGQAFIRSWPLATSPVTDWRTGSGSSVSISKTSRDYKSCCLRNERSFWIPRSRTQTTGFRGPRTDPAQILFLPLCRLRSCWG